MRFCYIVAMKQLEKREPRSDSSGKKDKRKRRKPIVTVLWWMLAAAASAGLAVLVLDLLVVGLGGKYLVAQAEARQAQCIIVPGAMVWGDVPSAMLQDRLDVAFELYQAGAAPKILVSGDHGQQEYDEVNTMRRYLEDRGVPTEDIFMDHAGFDTYDTMYRAKSVFQVQSAIVVTQRYHEYRALFLAHSMGIQVQGVACDRYRSRRQWWYDMREILARAKDFVNATVLRPDSKYGGEAIPISGSGIATHDE